MKVDRYLRWSSTAGARLLLVVPALIELTGLRVEEGHSFDRPVNGVDVSLIGRGYKQGAKIFSAETTISGSLIWDFDDLNRSAVLPIEYEQVVRTMTRHDDLTRCVKTEAIWH